ncbi:MAG: hypothetical protein ACMUJM_16715 [bacterium]
MSQNLRIRNGSIRRIISLTIIMLFLWTSGSAMTHVESVPQTVKQLKRYYPSAQFYMVDWAEFQGACSFFQESKVIVAHNAVFAMRKEIVVLYFPEKNFFPPRELMKDYPFVKFYAVEEDEFEYAQSFCAKESSNEEILIKEEFERRYLGIEFCVMSKETFQRIEPHLKEYRIIRYAEDNGTSDKKPSPMPHEPFETDEHFSSNTSCLFNTHFTSDKGCILPDVPDEVAAILYVVIGVVVVAVLIIYGGKYFYDVATGRGDFQYWWEVGAQSTFFNKADKETALGRGSMAGLKFTSGIIDQDIRIGLAGEVGYLAVKLNSMFTSKFIDIDGLYGVIGPAIRLCWGKINPHYLSLELLAGSSEHDEVGIISTARAGINWGIMEHIRFGINGGAIYFNLNETEGLFDEEGEFRFIIGIEVGYRF